MEKYSITGNFIFPDLIKGGRYNKYCITLINNERVYIYSLMNQISIIDTLTVDKQTTFFDTLGFQNTIFRKYIVKITEVK